MVPLDTLRRYPYFSGLQTKTLEAIAAVTTQRQFKAGETLFREGAQARYLYVLEEGEVEIRYGPPSAEPRAVDTIVPCALLCWSSIVEPHRTTATAVARVDSYLLCIHGRRIRDLCRNDTALGYGLMVHVARTVGRRLQASRAQVATGK